MNLTGERTEETMSGSEETKLIRYRAAQGWTAEEILKLLKAVRG